MGGTLSKPDRSRSLEVICAGYSRTGTSSLQLALEKLLNGPVYHGGTQIWLSGDDARVKAWGLACDAKYIAKDRELAMKYIKEATKGYVGQLDCPSIFLLPELAEVYPEAKVVLNTRDPEKWWASFGNLLGHLPFYFDTLTAVRPGVRWIPKILRAFHISVDGMLRDAGLEPGKYGPFVLELHHEMVKKTIPKERLLVMQVQDGWEPLAKFLGKPIPDEPFPHINETATLNQQAKAMLYGLTMTWAGILLAVGVAYYFAWHYIARF